MRPVRFWDAAKARSTDLPFKVKLMLMGLVDEIVGICGVNVNDLWLLHVRI